MDDEPPNLSHHILSLGRNFVIYSWTPTVASALSWDFGAGCTLLDTLLLPIAAQKPNMSGSLALSGIYQPLIQSHTADPLYGKEMLLNVV